jgi:hypothetical protein
MLEKSIGEVVRDLQDEFAVFEGVQGSLSGGPGRAKPATVGTLA